MTFSILIYFVVEFTVFCPSLDYPFLSRHLRPQLNILNNFFLLLMPHLFSLKYLVFSNNWKVLALAGTPGTNPAIHSLETAFLKIHSYFRGSCVVMYFKVCKTVHIILNYMTPWISSWWYAVVKKMMSDETKLIWKKKFHLITMPFVVFNE